MLEKDVIRLNREPKINLYLKTICSNFIELENLLRSPKIDLILSMIDKQVFDEQIQFSKNSKKKRLKEH